MELVELIKFHNWANNVYLDYISNLDKNQYITKIPGYPKSIEDIVKHLCEVYWYWITLITDQNWNDEPEWDTFTKDDMITMVLQYNDKILEITKTDQLDRSINLQNDEADNEVVTTVENILFNFVTHSAYHRGQLAIYLRFTGLDSIKETDFNPYIYEINQ